MGDTENMDNGFEEFRTSLFGGYRKGDVIEYIEHLSGEIENIRTEKKSMERELKEKGEQLKSLGEKIERIMQSSGDVTVEGIPEILQEKEKEIERLRNICNELKSANESSRAAREQLEKELLDMNERIKLRGTDSEEEYVKLTKELREKISAYEERSAVITDVLTEARVQAEKMVSNANQQAERLVSNANFKAEKMVSDASSQAAFVVRQAEDDAAIKKRAAENVYQKEVEQQIEQLLTVKVRMSDYLDILDELQQGIAKIYGSMSRAMTGIPTDVKQLKEMAEQNIVDSSNGGETRLLE
ncbi:MAG: hypothetical protein HFG14_02370 [Lachnospiraceae bacterium]|jgi:cell division septum initiation protein DivIVA|nr:hypothetical protein [Lachnospiraceae bacterium]